MSEYIEREAIMQAFADHVWNSNHSDFVPAPQWNHAVDIVRDIPAADVVEVRHGENIGEDYDAVDQFVCSECGIELQGWYRVERDMDDGDETHHEYVMRYCPNCGIKLDGGADDDQR